MKTVNVKYYHRFAIVLVLSLFAAAPAADEISQKSLSPINSGPVLLSDLQVLLNGEILFQLFHFDSQSDFCLYFGYTYEVNGLLITSNDFDGGMCQRGGKHRVVVKMAPVEDVEHTQSDDIGRYGLTFSVHDRETGTGGSFSYRPLEVEVRTVRSNSLFINDEMITPGKEIPVLTWALIAADDPGKMDTQRTDHEVRVTALLTDNSGGIVGTAPYRATSSGVTEP